MTDVSVIIPVYNSAGTLSTLVGRIGRSLAQEKLTFEIIMIDDGSRDASWQAICDITSQIPQAAGIRLAQNMGQHAATIAGLQAARGNVSVTLDDDLQHPPEHIGALYRALTPDLDLIYAAPVTESKPGHYLSLARIARRLIAVAGRADYLGMMQTFRLLRTSIYPWKELPLRPTLTVEGIIAAKPLRAARIHVPYGECARGQSTYNFWRLGKIVLLICVTGMIRRPWPFPCPVAAPIQERAGWLAK
jgi:glycosyltransferase involved in cell wall biosynthesis